MDRPALATAGTVLGILLLLGGKAVTSPNDLALATGPSVLASTASGTVTGPVIDTRYGPVQVRVVAASGRITDVTAVQLPVGGRSGDIADYAARLLRDEALAAQGAGIQAVSGATYTSQGYASSLQAAPDQLAASSASASIAAGVTA